MNFIYKWLISKKIDSYPCEFEDIVRIAEEYNLISEDDQKRLTTLVFDDTDSDYIIFKDVTKEKNSYNIFIGDIHIRMETSEEEAVYSIHIKKHCDDWIFLKEKGGNINHSIPATQTYRVYVYYDIPVLDITRTNGESYIYGPWNKYVYNTINKLICEVNNNREMNQFNNEYRNRLKFFEKIF